MLLAPVIKMKLDSISSISFSINVLKPKFGEEIIHSGADLTRQMQKFLS